jgi:peptide alpha-N-acetyltransferase
MKSNHKLLFLSLLRTVSAMATSGSANHNHNHRNHNPYHHQSSAAASAATRTVTSSTRSSNSNNHHDTAKGILNHHSSEKFHNNNNNAPPLILRKACVSDVLSIQRCNLATLPENYNEQFYVSHLRQWPELALVVVEPHQYSPFKDTTNNQQRKVSWNPLLNNNNKHLPSSSSSSSPPPPDKVVAYVLGKVEHVPMDDEYSLEETYSSSNSNSKNNNNSNRWYESDRSVRQRLRPKRIHMQSLGHVTSLAVLEPYRRRGLAEALMHQLHVHLKEQRVATVGLHVRQSNLAASQLYQNVLQYQVVEKLPEYYQDGEDAYLMQKDLLKHEYQKDGRHYSNKRQSSSSLSSFSLETLWNKSRRSPFERNNNKDLPIEQETALEKNVSPFALPRIVGQAPRTTQPVQQERRDELETSSPELLSGSM